MTYGTRNQNSNTHEQGKSEKGWEGFWDAIMLFLDMGTTTWVCSTGENLLTSTLMIYRHSYVSNMI